MSYRLHLAKFHMGICLLNIKICQSALGCYILGGKSLTGCRSIFHWDQESCDRISTWCDQIMGCYHGWFSPWNAPDILGDDCPIIFTIIQCPTVNYLEQNGDETTNSEYIWNFFCSLNPQTHWTFIRGVRTAVGLLWHTYRKEVWQSVNINIYLIPRGFQDQNPRPGVS